MKFIFCFLLLSFLLTTQGCGSPSHALAPEFEAQIRADVHKMLLERYGLKLKSSAATVSNSCTPVSCQIVVGVGPDESGLTTQFLIWPNYEAIEHGWKLVSISDNLKAQVIGGAFKSYFAAMFELPDAPLVAVRVGEYHDFVSIESELPNDIKTLSALTGANLLERYRGSIGANLNLYVYDTPANFEPRARNALSRLLNDPRLKLGKGYSIVWYFRSDALPAGANAADYLKNAENRWLPESTPENTSARWTLNIAGANYADDLTQSSDKLFSRLDKFDPFSN